MPRFLPKNFSIVGYARTPLTDEQLHERLRPYLNVRYGTTYHTSKAT